MKKQFIIEIETDNMAPVYSTDDISKQSKETEQIGFFEEQIVTGIKLWIKEQLKDEFLNDALLDNLIPDFEFQGVEGWTDLSQYGTIKVTLIDDDKKEVLCFFQREKIPDDVVDEETEAEMNIRYGKYGQEHRTTNNDTETYPEEPEEEESEAVQEEESDNEVYTKDDP